MLERLPEASSGTFAHPSRIYGPPRHRLRPHDDPQRRRRGTRTQTTMDLRPPRLYKWYKPIDEREKALDQPDLTEEQRAAMDLARPPAPSLPGAPEGEPGAAAPAAAPDAEDEGEPVVFTAPEHVQIQTREEQLEEIRQMGLGDLCMDDPEPKIAMPDWAGGGSESLGVKYDEEREKVGRELA